MKIEVGKWYKTRGGAKVFVGLHVPKGKAKPYVGYQVTENDLYFCDMCWRSDGASSSWGAHAADIIEEWKEPKTGVSYVNVFEELAAGNCAFTTKEEANRAANRAADAWGKHKAKRLACVRVEWKEGQFDE